MAQTESTLTFSLKEIAAIEGYEAYGNKIISDNKEIFVEIVNRIVAEETSQNEINEEFIAKEFNCEDYETQRILQSLIYYEAGKKLSGNCNIDLEKLENLYDNVYGSLFYGLALPHDKVASLINILEENFEEEVLLKSRCIHSSKETLLSEIKDVYTDCTSEKDIMHKMDMYNNGAYTELPLAVDAISYICRLHGYDDLWLRLFESLKYFQLQGSLLYQLHSIDDYIQLLKFQSAKKNYAVVCKLVLDKFLRLLNEASDNLERNMVSKLLSEEQQKYGDQLCQKWNDQYDDTVSVVAELLVEGLGVDEFVSWYSRELRRVEGMAPKYAEHYKHALQVMGNVISSYTLKNNKKDFADCSFDTLMYYSKVIPKSNTPATKCLIKEICKRAYTDKYVYALQLTDGGFEKIRYLYSLLDATGIDGLELMRKYRRPDEGYAVDSNASLSKHYGDNFWLPVLVLQNENNIDRERFETIISSLLKLVNTSTNMSFDDYFTSLYLAELIVTQVALDMQDGFESKLIRYASNLMLVLRILTANEGKMSPSVAKLLKDRIDTEWDYEKKVHKSKDKEMVKFLESYIERIETLAN